MPEPSSRATPDAEVVLPCRELGKCQEFFASIGFRLVRPLASPVAADLPKFWEADVEKVKYAVEQRLREGRGGLGVVAPK